MKITILTKNLKSALENLTAVIEKKPTLPILAMASFRTYNKKIIGIYEEIQKELPMLELRASDMDHELKIDLTCESVEVGEVCIDAAGLLEICKKTKSLILEIETSEEIATVKAGEDIFKLETKKFRDFPIFKSNDLILVDLEGFCQKLEFASSSIACDKTRDYLNGVNLKSNGEQLEIVSTDGHTLIKTSLRSDLKLEKINNIIPSRTIKSILKIFKGRVKIGCDGYTIKIVGGEGELISKLIDGHFPEYERVIPDGEAVFSYEINAKELAAAIKKIMPKDKNKSIFFEFGERLKLESKLGGVSIACGGKNYKTALNGEYMLKICKFGNFTMDFKDNAIHSAATIENCHGLAVVMPLNL